MEVPYDLIILGASGFTGKYVVREALKFLNTPQNPSQHLPLTSIAIAGRNRTKLKQSLTWASHPNPPPPIPILTADTSDPNSLRHLCSKTKLILNCVGPFRLHGEPVVAACAELGCDYLDICGEPEFMERMEADYHDNAAENGSLVVSACGFDSIPAELGVMYHSRQWVDPSVPNSVEAYLSLESEKRIVGNFATYESAVLGVANADKLVALRRSRPRRPRPNIPGPPPTRGGPIINEHLKELSLRSVRLPSADATVVRKTLTNLTENPQGLPGVIETPEQTKRRESFWSSIKPVHFGVNICSKSSLGLVRFIMIGMLIGLLGRNSFGRWLLLAFPYIFSLGMFRKVGPTEEQVKSAGFKMWFVGRGFHDASSVEKGKTEMEIVTRVMGPEIGYVTTPIILIQCALVLLKQRESLPKGGVLPPGIVFGATDLQERLQENGISFDLISVDTLSKPKPSVAAA